MNPNSDVWEHARLGRSRVRPRARPVGGTAQGADGGQFHAPAPPGGSITGANRNVVAQVGNLLYRRLAIGGTVAGQTTNASGRGKKLQTGVFQIKLSYADA
jgi:hypothetical protein